MSKTYTPEELREVLTAHGKWLRGENGGSRAKPYDADLRGANLREADLREANLYDADLREADLCGADLRGAYLREADLRGANLYGANLRGADPCGANLCGANLRDANLYGANLRYADLCGADLCGADLCCANLHDANLRGADLRGANLYGANLSDAKTDEKTRLPAFLIVPQLGAFIAWKKAGGHIVKLEIPADARRVSTPVGRKCRAEFVRVLEIEGADEAVTEEHGPRTFYRVGEIVRPDSYDDDWRVECSHGIHFYMTREEAMQW
jgi:hypothetical protein